MTKKLLGSLIGALFCITTVNATGLSCNQTTGTNPATFQISGTNASLSGVEFLCTGTVPVGDTLNSIAVGIGDSFSNGINSQTNTVDFTYTFNGFTGVSSLTTSSSSNPTSGQNGADTDLGGIVSESPNTGLCTSINDTLTQCTINPGTTGPESFSFSIIGSSSWVTGGLVNGGSDGFNVSGTYSYSPTVTTPEPASLMMIGGGLVGLAMLARRKRKV
jgi:PEP-CTERM motif